MGDRAARAATMVSMTAPRLDEPNPSFRVSRRRQRLRALKQVPVLPSLITLGNLFFGFLAMFKIVDGVQIGIAAGDGSFVATPVVLGHFESAAILIFLAMVFDALDGGVARLTNQATPFGAQLDSMADMVTFGAAPAFMCKLIIDAHAGVDGLLPPHPKLYYGAAAIYVLCAALRLARFNVETGQEEEDHREFKGLPSPAAAAVVCAMVAFYCTRAPLGLSGEPTLSGYLLPEATFDWLVRIMPAVLVVLGLLMVSRLPFPHLTYALMRGGRSFPFLATTVVFLGVAAVEWQFALLVMVSAYLVSGFGLGIYRLVTTGSLGTSDEEDDVDPSPN